MRTRGGNLVEDDQKLVWFPEEEDDPWLSREKPFEGLRSVYLDTLPRDISAHVMPIGGTSRARKDFAVRLEPHDRQFEEVIATGLEQGGSYREDLSRPVCNFFQHTAARIMQSAGAAYEVVLLRDRANQNVIGFDLFAVSLGSLDFKGETVTQIVPSDWATEHSIRLRIEVHRSKVIVFSLPPEYRDLRDIKDALKQLGGAALVQMYETAQAEKDLGYDAKEHIRAEHLALAAAARSTGWSAGQNLYELFTEYYVLHRRLVFERSIVSLRESILGTLNQALGFIAPHFGKSGTLRIDGLPSIDDANRAMRELSTGSRTFGSVLDDFSLL